MTSPEEPPVKKRVRWRRLVSWFCGTGIVVTMILLAVAWWLWAHRVEYINRSLASMHGRIGSLTLTKEAVTVRGFELRDEKTNDLLLRLPELVVNAGLNDVWHRRVNLVTLNNAEVSISESYLEQLLKQSDSSKSPDVIVLPGGWKIGRVELLNARLLYVGRSGAREEVIANFYADDLFTGSDGALSVGEQNLTIKASAVAESKRAPITLEFLHTRGQVHAGQITLDELSIVKPSMALTPELLNILAPAKAADVAMKPVAKSNAASFVQKLSIKRLRCDDATLSATGFIQGNIAGIELPEIKAKVSYEMSDFHWAEGKPLSPGTQHLRIEHLELKSPPDTGSITCREITLIMPPPRDGKWTIEQLSLREPEIVWTPELRKILISPASSKDTSTHSEVKQKGDSLTALFVANAEVHDANISVADADLLPMELRGSASVRLQDLLLDEKGVHSTAEQALELKDVALGFPAKKPFFELTRGEFAIRPDEWNESKKVHKLVLSKPVMRIRDANTPWLTEGGAPPAKEPATSNQQPASLIPIWQQIHFGTIEIADGTIDISAMQNGHQVDVQTNLMVMTDAEKPGLHRLRLENFEARLPGLTLFPFPVARASFVEGAASFPAAWKDHRVESLQIGGANIEASEALMKFFESTSPAAPATSAKPEVTEGPAWKIGEMKIMDSHITLTKLVPGMDSVNFDVSLNVKDAPLSSDGLAADVAPQRIELANLLVPSPYGGPPVAKLDSVFVTFSLAGLAKKQIDKVEIVSPTLYIGEPLFWYVDYYRKYAELGAPGSETKVAATDKNFALEAASAVVAQQPKTSEAAWDVRTLQVHSGKLVIAPKGVPLAGFRTPFPFSFTSEVTRGTLEADFEIPADNYELEDIKLAFEGLSGKVQFNLPMKGRDNNVTETFKVNRIRWKELHIENAFLTVTYDAAGIYGKFGGNAYEGYVNGEFNIYLDDVYTWDGWISGKDVQTREITQKMFPEYFFMEGKVATKLVAFGDGKEVYQADGSFSNETPGKFSIQALNDLIKTLPDSMSGVKQQLAQITLETLRDFPYDRAEGKFRTYGREGRGTLKFSGPAGTRNFEINAFDHRWKTDEPKPPQKESK